MAVAVQLSPQQTRELVRRGREVLDFLVRELRAYKLQLRLRLESKQEELVELGILGLGHRELLVRELRLATAVLGVAVVEVAVVRPLLELVALVVAEPFFFTGRANI